MASDLKQPMPDRTSPKVGSEAGGSVSFTAPNLKFVNHYKCIKPNNRSSRLVGLAAVLPSCVLQSIGHRDCLDLAVSESGLTDLSRAANRRNGESGRLSVSTEHNENKVANR